MNKIILALAIVVINCVGASSAWAAWYGPAKQQLFTASK